VAEPDVTPAARPATTPSPVPAGSGAQRAA
jgi:hypothetical protein